MAETLKTDYDQLIQNLALLTSRAFTGDEFAVSEPYVPEPSENYLEEVSGSYRVKSAFDVHAGMMVDVTETFGLYRSPKVNSGEIFDRRDLLVEWDNGDFFEVDLDDGRFTDSSEVINNELAQHCAQRMLRAIESLLP